MGQCNDCKWYRVDDPKAEKGMCVAWGPEVITIQTMGGDIPGINLKVAPKMDTLTIWPTVMANHDCIKYEQGGGKLQ